ncbi:unnamed protein product, partial [Polarella glacialis]
MPLGLLSVGAAASAGAGLLWWRRQLHALSQAPSADENRSVAGGGDAAESQEAAAQSLDGSGLKQPKASVRNAEKDRRATCPFADQVAHAAIAEYEKRRPADWQHRQTCLAGILALRAASSDGHDSEGELFIVSFGVGTKFLSPEVSKQPEFEEALRDMHAEVLARRGLVRFLHQDLLRCLRKESCSCVPGSQGELLERSASGAGFRLRADTTLHLYTSSVPCGNASWKRWATGGSQCPSAPCCDESRWQKQRHPRIILHARHEGQACFLVKHSSASSGPPEQAASGVGPCPVGTSQFLGEWTAKKQ